jgi:ABC-type transport system involved in multi-copper enzyme maturation permease subunit
MLTQTAALFLDAYRELNAKKMFWITLVISAFIVAAFAIVGINSKGITVLWFEFPTLLNTTLVPKDTFYKLLFSSFGVGYWLNWFGIILALVSTAGIIPEFVAGGSVDLYLSKPISRLRLFLTKYLTGLIFVAMQVSFFAVACFILIGIRAGAWDFKMFLAIPVCLLVFSYLFCICALLGLVTRSTVAALLLTILFWLLIFGIDTSAHFLLMNDLAGKIETQAYQNQLSYSDKELAMIRDRITAGDKDAPAQLQTAQTRRRAIEDKKRASDPSRRNVATASALFDRVQGILPKTGQTSALLERWLQLDTSGLEEEQLERRDRRRAARGKWFSGFGDRTEVRFDDAEVVRQMEDIKDSRSATKIIGSSLLFEAVILALSCWIFARRDY